MRSCRGKHRACRSLDKTQAIWTISYIDMYFCVELLHLFPCCQRTEKLIFEPRLVQLISLRPRPWIHLEISKKPSPPFNAVDRLMGASVSQAQHMQHIEQDFG